MEEEIRKAFEDDAGPYGYDLTMGSAILQETRGDLPFVYQDGDTNHRWLGFLAGVEYARGKTGLWGAVHQCPKCEFSWSEQEYKHDIRKAESET